MSYAPSSVYLDTGDGSIVGQFKHKDTDVFFEYSENLEEMTDSWNDFPHKIWVLNGKEFRYAKVLKTVAYICVDEDAQCQPVVEKWDIKQHKVYPK